VLCCETRELQAFPKTEHAADHDICLDCWTRYLEMKFQNISTAKIPCPDTECTVFLEYEESRLLSSKESFER
jgi:hypothetical protein